MVWLGLAMLVFSKAVCFSMNWLGLGLVWLGLAMLVFGKTVCFFNELAWFGVDVAWSRDVGIW